MTTQEQIDQTIRERLIKANEAAKHLCEGTCFELASSVSAEALSDGDIIMVVNMRHRDQGWYTSAMGRVYSVDFGVIDEGVMMQSLANGIELACVTARGKRLSKFTARAYVGPTEDGTNWKGDKQTATVLEMHRDMASLLSPGKQVRIVNQRAIVLAVNHDEGRVWVAGPALRKGRRLLVAFEALVADDGEGAND